MLKRTRSRTVAASIVVLALSLSACRSGGAGSSGDEAAPDGPIDLSKCPSSANEKVEGDTITLGVSAALSGPQASTADTTRGLQAYFERVNEQGGVKTVDGTKKLELKVLDDQGEPSKTIQNVTQLVQKDGVTAMAGIFGTATNLAVAPLLTRECVPDLWAIAGGATLPSKYSFATQSTTYTVQGRAIGEYIAKDDPDAKVAVLFENDDIGTDAVKGLDDSGVDVVDRQSYEVTSADVSSQITTLSRSGADTIFLQAISTKCTQALNAIGQTTWRPKIYTTYVCGTAAAAAGPKEVTKNLYGSEYRLSAGGPDAAPAEFVDQMKKSDIEVSTFASGGWESGELTVAAIENAKVLTSAGIAQSARSLPASLKVDMLIPGIRFSSGKSGPATYDAAVMRFDPDTGFYDIDSADVISGK